MNWELHVENLKKGENVQFRPKGNSMQGKIESGQLVTVEPAKHEEIEKNDIVLCKVKGTYYVHLVTGTQQKMGDKRFQIGNNKGHTNGWVGSSQVYGKVIRVEP